jgi:hypothetical protein
VAVAAALHELLPASACCSIVPTAVTWLLGFISPTGHLQGDTSDQLLWLVLQEQSKLLVQQHHQRHMDVQDGSEMNASDCDCDDHQYRLGGSTKVLGPEWDWFEGVAHSFWGVVGQVGVKKEFRLQVLALTALQQTEVTLVAGIGGKEFMVGGLLLLAL